MFSFNHRLMVAAVAAIACGAALRPAAAAYTYTTVGNPAIAGGYAYALNNSGQVATTSLVTSHFFNDPSTYASPVQITIPGITTATSTPGVVAQGMNDAGEVVGRYRVSGNPANQTSGFIRRSDGSVDTVNYPGVASTSVSEINNSGVIVGETRSDLTVFGVIRGFVAIPDGNNAFSFSEIHYPGATLTRAYGISDSGDIVGQYQNSDAVNRAFLFRNGTYADLAPTMPPGGYQSILVQSISDNGMTLGTYRDSTNVSRAFVRLADGTWTYPELLGSPRAINNAGQIAGSFLDPANGNTRTAYVASVPEPSGFVMAFSLVGAALVRWRRRLPAISRPVALTPSPMTRAGMIGALACSVGLIFSATAQAQHAGDILVGKTAASQLTAVNLPTGIRQLPSVNSGALFGWASNSMGVDNFFGADSTRDISQLASGGYVSLEVISIDPRLSFRSFSAFTTVFADEAGETLPIGPSNSLHNHPIVFIDGAVVGPDFRAPLSAQIRFIDTGATALSASPTYTMTFAPAVPEPASISLLGASAVFLLRRRRAVRV